MQAPEMAGGAAGSGTAPARYGELFDRGYKHYDGPRLGRRRAFGALVRYSIKRSLGIKKSWTAKVIPIILYVAVTIPVIVSVGIRAFLPTANVLDYPNFFDLIFIIEAIFVATIAPEMLCGDRRENVLPLYFSRAIARMDYLLAKLTATAILTLTISLVPPAVLWLGLQLLEDGPLGAMKDNLGDLGRVALAGVTIALYIGALGLTVASFTGRKSIAVGISILAFTITTTLSVTLGFVVEGALQKYMVFLSPLNTSNSMVNTLVNRGSSSHDDDLLFLPTDFTLGVQLGEMGLVVLICCAIMWWRYRPNE